MRDVVRPPHGVRPMDRRSACGPRVRRIRNRPSVSRRRSSSWKGTAVDVGACPAELCPGIIFPSPYPPEYGDTPLMPTARRSSPAFQGACPSRPVNGNAGWYLQLPAGAAGAGKRPPRSSRPQLLRAARHTSRTPGRHPPFTAAQAGGVRPPCDRRSPAARARRAGSAQIPVAV